MDVAEVATRRFFEGRVAIKEVSIGTQMIEEEAGRSRPVSIIEIKLHMTE